MTEEQEQKIKDFIGKSVWFDDYGCQYLWGKQRDGSDQMIGEVRGWGAIQHLFMNKDGSFIENGEKLAEKFQDDLGRFIAEAITEKLNRKS